MTIFGQCINVLNYNELYYTCIAGSELYILSKALHKEYLIKRAQISSEI